jgi:hypothetical protein
MRSDLSSANSSSVRVQVYLNRNRLWLWHLWLLESLAEVFPLLEVCFVDSGRSLPVAVKLLLTLERLIFRLPGEHACDNVVDRSKFSAFDSRPENGAKAIELALNLTGSDLPEIIAKNIERALFPLFDGIASDDALINVILDGRVPVLTVGDLKRPEWTWTAVPAVENRQVLTIALDNMFSTLMRLCIKAMTVTDIGTNHNHPSAAPLPHSLPPSWSAIRFEAKAITSKALAKLTKLCVNAPRWFVGWRWATSDRIHLTCNVPPHGYYNLRDDGRRCYADPFVIDVDGRHHLFVEEFDYSLGRGVISATIISRNGEPEPPRVVLDRPYHLSFPFIFAHGGHIWMIPESSAARTVELYRAESFPNRWKFEATLLNDISLADAVVFVQNGLWWMFASSVEYQSSSWDALSIFYAPDLLGPWTPHPQNPVLIDAHCARPAGNIFRRSGQLWRTAQDCSSGYGSCISLCSIDKLDIERYAQSSRAVLKPPPGWHSQRMHTLNWSAGLEVIDGFGNA